MKQKHLHIFAIVVLLAVTFIGCKQNTTPVTRQVLDSMLVSGQLEYYGTFYKAEGIDYDVISLDLYSRDLYLNDKGSMEGVGTNLYISDIFVPAADGTLPEGTYRSDSVARLMHFLRGLDYDGNYGGSYVLLVGETGYSVFPVTEAQMTIAYHGDTLLLDGIASLKNQKDKYPFRFRNTIPTIHREQ